MKRTVDDREPRREPSVEREDAARRRLRRSESSSDSAKRKASKPKVEQPPRTVEVLWDGRAAPGFTLKRKRCGAIHVSTVAAAVAATTKLRVGSELRLVGGFPVARLTLKAVKKVMLCAPKPVSLVFVNPDELDVLLRGGGSEGQAGDTIARLRKDSTVSEASLSAVSEASAASTSASSRSSSVASASDSAASSHRPRRAREAESAYGERTAANASKKRKVSRLQVALDRVNQLLNRPVRQSGLNIPASQSIVV